MFVVEENLELKKLLPDLIKDYVWPHVQFISNEAEEIEAMTLLLKHTSEWKKLQHLEGLHLKNQVREYLKFYGPTMTGRINSFRNQGQQDVRGPWMVLYKKGKPITAKQLLWVAQRPDVLIIKKEVDDNGQEIP